MSRSAIPALLASCLAIFSEAQLIERRQFQTDATCTSNFSWANNHLQQTPCIVAAYVNGACGSNTYRVTKLTPNNRYDPPLGATATRCSCSWAFYNLLQGCAACQGNAQDSISTWAGFSDPGCKGLLSNEYFPHDIAIADGTAIPAWAATDPRTWHNQQFDADGARQIASEGLPDVLPHQSTKSSAPVGPIVGGVVGGLVVVGIACAIFVYFRIRRRKSSGTRPVVDKDDMQANVPSLPATRQHMRGMSTESKQSLTSGYLTSYPPSAPSYMVTHSTSPSSPTQLGHSDDLHSHYQSNPSPSIFSASSATPGQAAPPNIPPPEGGQITPFPLSGPSHPNDTRSEKSRLEGSRLMVYDNPSLPNTYPETQFGDSRPSTPGIGSSQRRFNPPAYESHHRTPSSPLAQPMDLSMGDAVPAYSATESSSPASRPRREKGSADSHSTDSPGVGPSLTRGEHVRLLTAGTVAANSVGSMSEFAGIMSRFDAERDGTATQSGLETGNSGNLHHPIR